MKYKLIQISAGVEQVICESDNKNVIRRLYNPENKQRIKIDDKILLTYQAEAWVHGEPIKEYHEKKPAEKKPKIKEKRGPGGRPKRVCKVTENGEVIEIYSTIEEASIKNYVARDVIVKAYKSGKPTFTGQYFKQI